jgi:multidrug transporter EmrE-like cation transporter
LNLPTFLILLAGVTLNATAQLLLKAGVRPLGAMALQSTTLFAQIGQALVQPPILVGLGCYGVSVVLWIVALSRVDVSVAYPMLSLGYVLNAVAARWLFGEMLAVQQMIGIAFILVGVTLVARH